MFDVLWHSASNKIEAKSNLNALAILHLLHPVLLNPLAPPLPPGPYKYLQLFASAGAVSWPLTDPCASQGIAKRSGVVELLLVRYIPQVIGKLLEFFREHAPLYPLSDRTFTAIMRPGFSRRRATALWIATQRPWSAWVSSFATLSCHQTANWGIRFVPSTPHFRERIYARSKT